MNIILKLLDREFVLSLFKKELLPILPEMTEIKKIEIEPIKNQVWRTTYHVVFRYITTFTDERGVEIVWPIYATAHSSEPRKNVYAVLKFLWQASFSSDGLIVPRPLFYSEEFKAVFYRGVEGKLLYQSIKEKNIAEVETGLVKAAAWLAKLHGLPTMNVPNFNDDYNHIATVLPGEKKIQEMINERYPEYSKIYEKLYHLFTLREESFLDATDRLWLVHGDVHPENIIIADNKKVALVDFADFCLSDFARDLGTFLQQLEYMSDGKIGDPTTTGKFKKLFLNSYLDFAKIKSDDSLQARINNYYNWTAVRTASFFLFKHNPQPENARPLLKKICENLNITFAE